MKQRLIFTIIFLNALIPWPMWLVGLKFFQVSHLQWQWLLWRAAWLAVLAVYSQVQHTKKTARNMRRVYKLWLILMVVGADNYIIR